VVENMSHFIGDEGKMYHPFGRGGKAKILNTLMNSTHKKSSISDTVKDVPYHTFPISSSLSDDVVDQSVNTQSDKVPSIFQRDSDVSEEYNRLADSVINRLFIQQINAQLVRSLPLLQHTNNISHPSQFILMSM